MHLVTVPSYVYCNFHNILFRCRCCGIALLIIFCMVCHVKTQIYLVEITLKSCNKFKEYSLLLPVDNSNY